MKLPTSAHMARPWRIHEIAPDFRVEDVWELPISGGPNDFGRLVDLVASYDPTHAGPWPVRALFSARWKLGGLFGWDAPTRGVGALVASLAERLPPDLRARPAGPEFDTGLFRSLYRLDDEWAAETANE